VKPASNQLRTGGLHPPYNGHEIACAAEAQMEIPWRFPSKSKPS
jgi:hypothetical protein